VEACQLTSLNFTLLANLGFTNVKPDELPYLADLALIFFSSSTILLFGQWPDSGYHLFFLGGGGK
jgi:hypothetical protein